MASIAKSLVQNGVYATKTSDGYETYGGVQKPGTYSRPPHGAGLSSFLGVGLVQARWVMALYALIAMRATLPDGSDFVQPACGDHRR